MICFDGIKRYVEFNKIVSLNGAASECEIAGLTVIEIEMPVNTVYLGVEYTGVINRLKMIDGKALFVVYIGDIYLANRILWEC